MKPITKNLYESLIDAFRQTQVYERVAKIVKDDVSRSGGTCAVATAKKAWLEGWPHLDFRPIKEVIELEEASARRLLQTKGDPDFEIRMLHELTSDEALMREKARKDAIAARAAEGVLVREARATAIELLSNAKELLRGFNRLTPTIIKYLETMDIASDKQLVEAAKILWRIAISSRAATESGMKALQMERLLLGQPMDIIGVKDVSDVTESDALEELDRCAMVADRIRQRRQRRLDTEQSDYSDESILKH